MSSGPIKRFRINRLYGYKDVELAFSGPVLILIAGNGSGKTTILNALHAFLRRRFTRLRSLKFESIECEFENTEGPIQISKQQLALSGNEALSKRLSRLAEFGGVALDDVYDFVSSVYEAGTGSHRYRSHPVIEGLFENSPWGFDEITTQLDDLRATINESESAELLKIKERIVQAMRGIEIVYLPTYRRIENPLLSPRGRKREVRVRTRLTRPSQRSSEPTQMNYGLEDVEARLGELSQEVERISSFQYRSVSATIIDDALANAVASVRISPDELPALGSLTRFLQRVSRSDRGVAFDFGPSEPDAGTENRISAITEMYESGRINNPDQNVLRYFLSRLSPVIEKTQEIERNLQRFVEACNGYLAESSDEKSFAYEPNSMRVSVVNKFTEDEVPLGQLSSGEKQVVSMLARLYLHNKKNLVLIDEPELSLSIEWQRKIIPDMMGSGSVAQLLAITHSPFIFENELDPFSGSMNVERHGEGASK
jgi:predicted ATPase